MASPQVKNGYFLVSIEFFEELCKAHINRESRQMLDVIIRQTWGYHRKTAEIPTLLFEKLTGLGRQAIHKARKKLLDLNIITITQKGNSQVKTYCIQKDYEKWQVLPKKVTVTQKGNSPLPKKVTVRPQKGNSPLPKKVTVPSETYSNGNGSQVPKDNFKDNIKDIYYKWNSLNIIKHRDIEKLKSCISAKLRLYTKEEIINTMDNYKKILESEKHFFSYRWSLSDFFTRKNGNVFDAFLDENKPFENYLIKINKDPRYITDEEFCRVDEE